MHRANIRIRGALRGALLALVAGLVAVPPPAADGAPFSRGGEQARSVALHMHGSLSENNGSMEWHAQKAEEIGIDLIWWTDHDWRLSRIGYTTSFDFEDAIWDGSRFVEIEENYVGEEKYLEPYTYNTPGYRAAIVDSVASQGTRSLRLELADPWGNSAWKQIDFIQIGSRKHNKRVLAASPHLTFSLLVDQLDPVSDQFVVHVTLSERVGEWPELRYVIGNMDGEPAESIPLAWTPGTWNAIDLDLLADAQAHFTAGGADSLRAGDNSTYAIRFIVRTKDGGHVIVHLDDIGYSDDGSTGAELLDWERAMSAFYEAKYPAGPQYLHGSEISWFKAQPHLNAYAPDHVLVDYGSHGWQDSLFYAVDQVVAQGGIVSLNHPWGIGIYGNLNETPAAKAARILSMKRNMLTVRAWGCEMVEAGYRWRHGIDLAGHMDTWDTWTANAMFLTGVGVTDSHGTYPFIGWAPWQSHAAYENNYTTWLWSTGITDAELISAMRGGRAYFGDPYRWQGELDLATPDGFAMGATILTDKTSHDLVIRVTGLPDSAEVRLRQGEIRESPPVEYMETNWLRDEILDGAIVGGTFMEKVTVDTSLPAFVRIEVAAGIEELVFSNPLSFVHAVPAEGVPAERVGASLDQIRILSAEGFRLADASFQPFPAELAIAGDESPPGLGRLVVDVGTLGAPDAVLGAAGWTWDAGRLTLIDFGGAGAEIRVIWGAVDGPEPPIAAITDVSLSPGRPNPFGRGLVAEFTMPAAGPVLVEVLDVSGRRIRIVEDGFRSAGAHRTGWDGLDQSGRSVANGVYFLRLRALGTVLTTKAVKLR